MGNHVAGKAMGLAAQLALSLRQPDAASALEILDSICEPYRGCDAEFEAEDPKRPGHAHLEFSNYTDPHPLAALGMLMVEAFAPKGLAALPKYQASLAVNHAPLEEQDASYDVWRAEVYEPFRKRYDFC
jgi:hypothetical protein